MSGKARVRMTVRVTVRVRCGAVRCGAVVKEITSPPPVPSKPSIDPGGALLTGSG